MPTTRSDIAGPLTLDEIIDDEPLTLPPAWTPGQRPPFPVVAAIVPVIGAVALWLVTGSLLSLWLAALGPLVAVATVLDGRRGARRDRRRAGVEAAIARNRVGAAIERRHDSERARLRARHPDVSGFAQRGDEVWRGGGVLVVGEGDSASSVRVSGGEGDPDAAELRRRAARLTGAPVVVDLSAGVVVVGDGVVAAAAHRALILQACLAHPPGDVRLTGALRDDLEWARHLPHALATGGRVVAVVAPGDRVPPDADVVIARARRGDPLPPRCGAVLTVTAPDAATLQCGGATSTVRVECVGLDQAAAVARELADRAEQMLGMTRGTPAPVALRTLIASDADAAPEGLAAVIGVAGSEPVVVDLVADGPHAIVAGVTGAGKSELLLTWILSLCATRTADDVTFLLADFKGGTAFDPLKGLPHVTGTITDLDGSGARRAMDSLRAELRRREAAIAGAGARDIRDPRVGLPRLVVVVDELAALLAEHPEMHAVFADLAARGRALGIHLILGTQRPAGVVRENLLANCPLRVSLRVTDAVDSRALLGTDEAARLPGGASGRGTALVRRAGDAAPQHVRIALSGEADVAAAARNTGTHPAARPWLPPLPVRLPLADLRSQLADPATIVVGLADEPDRQRQRPVGIRPEDRSLLVVGAPGSGVTNALEVVAAQVPDRVLRVPADPEGVWDATAAFAERMPDPGAVVLVDDLDALALRLPPEYAQSVFERLESLVRRAGDAGVLVVGGAHRLTGPTARLGELFARRLLLPFPQRADHLAAGGEPSSFDSSAPAGRGTFDGTQVHVALAPEEGRFARVPRPVSPAPWMPAAAVTGFVARRSPAVRSTLAAWEAAGTHVVGVDAYASDPDRTRGAGLVVVTGEPDDWQRHWRVLADVRGDHDLVVDLSCAAELRVLTASRALPPYCDPGRGRAWLVSCGADPVRIVLGTADVRSDRRDARS